MEEEEICGCEKV